MNNPLLQRQFRVAFDRIEATHVEPAIRELIADARARMDAIAAVPGPRTWANTMQPLDAMTERLDHALAVVRHLEAAATTPPLREAYNRVEPLATEFYSSIPHHEGLWRALQDYAATGEAESLDPVRKRFLKKSIDGFRKQGAGLPPEKKEQLRRIDIDLAQQTTKFSEHVLDATNAWELIVEDETQLAGLPESAVAMARESAKGKGKAGWRFTLQAPSYNAVMTYLDDAAIREKTYRAYQTRAASGELSNQDILLRILELRRQKATLLGYADFADFVLEDRMAKSGARAQAFLDELRSKTEAAFREENAQLEAFRRELEGPDAPPMQPWDIPYYAEKLRRARYDLDEEMLRPYFALDNVTAGLFTLVEKVFGVTVSEQPGVPGWDPEVRFYHIQDADGTLLGGFYTDWFPRENKRGGAWMDVLLTGGPGPDGFEPHLGLMCGNMTPPSGGKPALLTHREVETVFHEFGHLLHHCLSKVEVRSLAGTNVAWDFVELPSQIMENWCWERESLNLFARHWQTGEVLPEELFERLRRTRTFRAANAQMRQLSFGFVDMALHRAYDPARDGNVTAYARDLMQQFSPAPLPAEYSAITGFTHLFANPVGYGAGYYSYKWAEVLDADAFTRFRNEGIFSASTGASFREHILSRGDGADPADLYRGFMGRDPDSTALLVRAGLAAPTPPA